MNRRNNAQPAATTGAFENIDRKNSVQKLSYGRRPPAFYGSASRLARQSRRVVGQSLDPRPHFQEAWPLLPFRGMSNALRAAALLSLSAVPGAPSASDANRVFRSTTIFPDWTSSKSDEM